MTRRMTRRLITLGLLLSALFLGCSGRGPIDPPPPPPEPIDSTPPKEIWFGPNLGSPDMLRLFAEPATWAHTRNYVSVFRFASEHIMKGLPGTEAENWGGVGENSFQAFIDVDAFRKLRQWGIQTLLGVGAVKPHSCDAVGSKDLAKFLVNRVEQSRGRVDIIGIDEPLVSATIHCGLTPREAARYTARFAVALKAAYPHLTIGLYEAYPHNTAQAIVEFVGLMAEEGFYPDFLSVDVDRNANVSNVSADMTAIAKTMRAVGKPYGQFLWGQQYNDAAGYRHSVLSWVDRLKGFALQPDFVQVESWEILGAVGEWGRREIPSNLPEGDPLAHTTLVLETAHRLQIPPRPVAALHIGIEDARTRQRIEGARVRVAGVEAVTTSDGYVGTVLPLLPPGFMYRIEADAAGYVSGWVEVSFAGERDAILSLNPIKPPPVKRTGVVRIENNSFVDDQGKWFAEAITLFPAIALVHEYPHIAARNCDLYQYGIDAIRVLGSVGGARFPAPGGGTADPWSQLVADPRIQDWTPRLAKTIDYFYDNCGMRTALTIFGGTFYHPSTDDQIQVVRHVLDVIRPRLHKIGWLEVANEMWQNGFGGSQGIGRARGLATTLRGSLPPNFPIALSTAEDTPNDGDPMQELRAMFEGSAATLYTPHFSRATNKVDGPWRPVRQAWECSSVMVFSLRGCVDNEPIGPGSSVNSERDTSRLVAAWLTAKIARLTGRVFHSDAGVWAGQIDPAFRGGHDDGQRGFYAALGDEPGVSAALESMRKLRSVLPGDLHTWSRTRHGFVNHPFAESFQRIGDHFTQIWPDGHTQYGVVRAYSGLSGDRFVVLLSGIRDRIDLRWSRPLEADVYSTKTGEWVGRIEAHDRAQTWRQSVDTDLVVIGRFR